MTAAVAKSARVPSLRLSVAVSVLSGLASVIIIPSALGYDPWAWLVWGRELLHFNLATLGGPSFKPLPVLLDAPFAEIGNVAPFIWALLVRSSFVLALFLAFRAGYELAGPVAAVAATATLALSGDIYVYALDGYSEPVLLVLALGALIAAMRRRLRLALGLLALAALLRPEVWPFLGIAGVLTWRELRSRWAVGLLVLGPPLLWIGLDWAASGTPFETAKRAHATLNNSVANAAFPAGEVVVRAIHAMLLPAVLLAIVALAMAARRRDRWVLVVAAVALGWVGIVAVLGQLGYPGDPRFLALAVAFLSVLAGVGLAWSLKELPPSRSRVAAVGATLVLLVFAVAPAIHAGRQVRLTARKVAQLHELSQAVQRTGGRSRVTAAGRPAINAWLQTALAWKLGVPLGDIRFTYVPGSHWPLHTPPGFVFLAPANLAGPPPGVGHPAGARFIARTGRWKVFLVNRIRHG